MRLKLLSFLLLGLVVLGFFGSAGIGNGDKDKACQSGRTTGLTGGTIVQKGEFAGVDNQVLTTMEVAAG
ncbi:hypothetical protein NF865_09175 [Thermococcus aggregans]|uniref:Uncharacterized protein n=1 Tax=Thermococcus aggregans TaxID=110163 RepID=A0A9E7MX71_THEAG|nr:hypothetical protein [Thermococcus aggregans]USS40460.1 hypothetical protein NF865_09175 [Thermococcus aggregans]